MKKYEGKRIGHMVIVLVDGKPLPYRFDLARHSPTGFEWGYGGSGPTQLALAMLADHCERVEDALNLHQRFKWEVVAGLPEAGWTLDTWDIDEAVAAIRSKEVTREEAEAG